MYTTGHNFHVDILIVSTLITLYVSDTFYAGNTYHTTLPQSYHGLTDKEVAPQSDLFPTDL